MHAPMKIKLGTPLVTWDPAKPVEEIEISPPRGIDILNAGYPFISSINPRTGEVQLRVEMEPMRRLIATTAKIPDAAVDRMEANDLYAAIEGVKIFFLYEGAKPSSNASSAPAAGAATRPSSGT